MKGMVFTEFLQMVEDTFSADMVDDIIDDAHLPHMGAYTAVGTYDHQELEAMIVALSHRTNIGVADLIRTFGEHVFSVFAKNFTVFFVNIDNALTFLETVEEIIHPQVLKIYPDALLPRFECVRNGKQLTMIYRSDRHFVDLAEGLIIGCGKYFGNQLIISRQSLPDGSCQFNIIDQS